MGRDKENGREGKGREGKRRDKENGREGKGKEGKGRWMLMWMCHCG